ncbi:MAG: nitrophenyl compound nitroreductase subunit ArsF family protein [Nanobdellota archaeon]
MKKLIIFMLVCTILIAGCTTNTAETQESDDCGSATCNVVLDTTETKETEVNVDKLEVYHFHGTNQCTSCITVGDYAEATVNKYFKVELEKGIIVFDHINGEKPENKELVQKYGATSSSLWLGVYDNDSFNAEQNTQVWYKIRDKQDYMDYLKGVIEQKLAGE